MKFPVILGLVVIGLMIMVTVIATRGILCQCDWVFHPATWSPSQALPSTVMDIIAIIVAISVGVLNLKFIREGLVSNRKLEAKE